MSDLTLGLTAELTLTVTESDTAAKFGSGLVPVFGTPALVGWMEAAAVQAHEENKSFPTRRKSNI